MKRLLVLVVMSASLLGCSNQITYHGHGTTCVRRERNTFIGVPVFTNEYHCDKGEGPR